MFNHRCSSVHLRSFKAMLDFYGTGSNVNGNLYAPNVKRDAFGHSLLYMGAVIWNNLPSILKSEISLDGCKNPYRRPLRN